MTAQELKTVSVGTRVRDNGLSGGWSDGSSEHTITQIRRGRYYWLDEEGIETSIDSSGMASFFDIVK